MSMLQLRPTFSESWYRVVGLRPRLRAAAHISRQYYRGERWYVVRDPAGNQFHRLSDAAYRFVGLLDGRHTVGEAWELVGGQLADDAPTQPEVIQILSQLFSANLLETDITPDASILLRRHKKLQQRQFQGRLMNILFPRIPLWDPDSFLVRWMPAVRPMLGKGGIVVWIGMVIAALAVVLPKWDDLKNSADQAIDPANWLFLWVAFILIKFIHEMGHAFACRRFGGEVHEMGIMFLVFVPTPYVDASSAWTFPNRWARMFVGAGGMIIELFVASILAFVWADTRAGTLIHGLAFNVMLIASVTTIMFNANPLLRYDGYYILSDFLEIPNLQQKSREYLMGLIKRHVFRIKSQHPLPSPWQRAQLFVYGLASAAYRVFVGLAIILIVAFKIPILGVLMAISGVITWLGVPIVKLLRYLALEPELHRKRGRAWAFSGAVTTALVLLLGVIPFPYHVDADAKVEARHEMINSGGSGFVQAVPVKDGQHVNAGQVLLVLDDADLRGKRDRAQAELDGAKVRRQSDAADDQSQRQMDDARISALTEELKMFQSRVDDMQIRAPIDGYVVAPQLHELIGQYVSRGTEVAMVAQTNELTAYAAVPQKDANALFGSSKLGKLRPDASVEVRLVGDPSDPIGNSLILNARAIPAGQNTARDPMLTHTGGGDAAADPSDPHGMKLTEPLFELQVTFANPVTSASPDGRFYAGQRAYVRVYLPKRPLAWQWLRKFLQIIQTQKASSLV
jgi:putative peptide zinc metalloprotease protein